MAARPFSTPAISWQASYSSHKPQTLVTNPKLHIFQSQCLGTTKLTIRPSLPKIILTKTTITASLPTANLEKASSTEKLPGWSASAIKSYALGRLEANKVRDMKAGTEALLVGILLEGPNSAAKYLWANGILLLKVREEILKVVGGDLRVGILPPESPPLNEAAQRAIDWATDEKLKSGVDGEVTTSHILLGVWYEENELGHKILAKLGFDNDKAKALHDLMSKPGFSD